MIRFGKPSTDRRSRSLAQIETVISFLAVDRIAVVKRNTIEWNQSGSVATISRPSSNLSIRQPNGLPFVIPTGKLPSPPQEETGQQGRMKLYC